MKKFTFFLFVAVLMVTIAASCDLFGFQIAGTKWEYTEPYNNGTWTITLEFIDKTTGTVTSTISFSSEYTDVYSITYTWDAVARNGTVTIRSITNKIELAKGDNTKLIMTSFDPNVQPVTFSRK